MKGFILRWKYRFLGAFIYRPNFLKRATKVEGLLYKYYTTNTSPTPQECRELARLLMIDEEL